MRKKCKTYIVLVMFFFGTVGQIKAEENIMIKNIARDNTLFTLDLYNQLKKTDGNLFFSPFSIFTALAMTWAGARENTAVQMAETLHFTEKPAQFHRAIGDLISQLNAVQRETDVELSIANAIWAQKGYQFLDEFFRIVQQSYQADLEQKLNFENVMAWQSRLPKRKVIVFFPKFKIESQFSLGQTLALMGMPDAFDPELADFSAMVGQKELYISAVIHKAFLEVNEEGSEAAAATGVVVSVTSIAPSPPIFKADHPFVFFIRDNKSQSILFLGRVLNPA